MTGEAFKAWRARHDFTQSQAANALGISRGSVENYERGSRREDGRPAPIPRHIALAMDAIDLRLKSPQVARVGELIREMEGLPYAEVLPLAREAMAILRTI